MYIVPNSDPGDLKKRKKIWREDFNKLFPGEEDPKEDLHIKNEGKDNKEESEDEQ